MTDPDATVEAALRSAATGQPRTVVVNGVRGSGKSRVVELARQLATEAGMTVMMGRGLSGADVAFDGLQTLLRPLSAQLDELVPEHAVTLHALSSGRSLALDPSAARIAFFRLICAISERSPTCIVVDDFDLFDRASADAIGFALGRLVADPVAAVLSTRGRVDVANSSTVQLEPIRDEVLKRVLTERGLAEAPARSCAIAARGNPGMAIALADGLTSAQRVGADRLPSMMRPDMALLQQQQATLGALDEKIQRALVVVAADDLGQIGPVRSALEMLGEDASSIVAAEQLGLIEIEGPSVRFVDPWLRPAAYYLVAPASRRAAHRALAESYAKPHQAAARAWQLAAAADGPSDSVAEALGLVAADAARRGGAASAIDTYARAADFAETHELRERLLLDALAASLDALDLDTARRIAERIDPGTEDAAVAVADVLELCGEPIHHDQSRSTDAAGPWAQRRAERLRRQSAARGGRFDEVEAAAGTPFFAHAQLAVAVAHRHAGRLASAREALITIDALVTASCAELNAATRVLHADLDHLAGRFDDCAVALAEAGQPRDSWTRHLAELVRARLDIARGVSSAQPWMLALSVEVATEPLSELRAATVRGCADRDADLLQRTGERAAALGLIIEAGEINLARGEVLALSNTSLAAEAAGVARASLWAIGVHAWDGRIALLESVPDKSSPAAEVPDPGLAQLSQAEMRVAEAVGAGMTNREAAASLFLSVKTIDFHLQQIYRKLALRSRTELAVRIAGDDRRERVRGAS